MEKHIKNLEETCRLCCGKVKTGYGYKNVLPAHKFKGEIQSFFNYDIGMDMRELHPPNLCSKCVRKMRKINIENPIHHHLQSIVIFENHSDTDCKVCSFSMEPCEFKLITIEFLTLAKIIEVGKKFNFSYAEKLKQHTFVRICDRRGGKDEAVISPAFVDLTIFIEQQKNKMGEFSWTMSIFEQNIDIASLNIDVPKALTVNTVEIFFQTVGEFRICEGNYDFPKVIEKRKEGHSDQRDNTRLECKDFTPFEKLQPTIRHKDCPGLIFGPATSERCEKCSVARKSLLILEKRPSLTSTKPRPKRPH
eukprot:TCONS_00028938-protein